MVRVGGYQGPTPSWGNEPLQGKDNTKPFTVKGEEGNVPKLPGPPLTQDNVKEWIEKFTDSTKWMNEAFASGDLGKALELKNYIHQLNDTFFSDADKDKNMALIAKTLGFSKGSSQYDALTKVFQKIRQMPEHADDVLEWGKLKNDLRGVMDGLHGMGLL